MSKEMIELLAKKYNETKDDFLASEIFSKMKSRYWSSSIGRLSKLYHIPFDEVEFIANEALYKTFAQFDCTRGGFVSLFEKKLKSMCIDYLRKYTEKKEDGEDVYYETKVDYFGLSHEYTEYNDAMEVYKKEEKNSDQRQLIAYLLSNATESAHQSAKAFMISDSFRDAAKLLGKDDKNSVIRPLRKLSREYSSDKFGQIYEYFTVATEKVG